MLTKENLINKVQLHDVDNWIRENKTLSFQNKWDAFKRQIQEGDQLWSYNWSNRREVSQGYAILRGTDKVINAFETAYTR